MEDKPYTIVDLPRVNDPRGNLTFIQAGVSLPFEINRCYWIYDVPGGMERHGRALRATSEMIVALSGSFDVVVERCDGTRHTIHLCRSYQAVVIEPMTWRVIENFSTNSVAMVLASTTYDENDYIRDYNTFKNLQGKPYDTPVTIAAAPPSTIDAATTHQKSDLSHCRIISLPRHLDANGSLTEVENTQAFPFALRRVFYMYDIPADSERGGHSHFQAEELIVAVSGSFDVTLHDGNKKSTYRLDRPYKALYIEPGIWRTLENFSAGSVCMTLTSEKYSEADYCRDYAEFMRLTSGKSRRDINKRFKFADLSVSNEPFKQELKAAAAQVIDSGRYIGGQEVTALEETLCRLTGTPHAIAVSNGLDALRMIFRSYIALGLMQEGDEVLVAANTYIASVLAITDSGLTPIFVEPDPDTHNINPQKALQAITTRTKAILAVHLYGRACWDKDIKDIAIQHQLIVVEDNAQAIGAKAPVTGLFGTDNTGALGHAAAFSFYPTKNIGAIGDAGAVTTHDPLLAQTIAAMRNYGSDRRYHNIYAGYNCRMDPIQAAMLRVKLRHIDEETDLRRALARVYTSEIDNVHVIKPKADDIDLSVWHQYVIRVSHRDAFRKYLEDNGVETDIHYATPPHLQPCYRQYSGLRLPITCQLANEVVSLPITRCTSAEDARQIAEIINRWKP